MRDVQSGRADKPFTVDFNYADKPDKGVRMHIATSGDAEVLLGRSPSVRRMGKGSRGDMRKVYDFWMPKLIVRRRGEGEQQSVFAVVHEPHDGARLIEKVVAENVGATVQLRVQRKDGADLITADEDGRITVQRGDKTWRFNHQRLRGAIIAAPSANSLTTDARLPQGDKLHGQWMIITHASGHKHGYEIDRVDGGSIILTHDHGLRIKNKKTEEVYYPQRTFKGFNRFVIPQSSSAADLRANRSAQAGHVRHRTPRPAKTTAPPYRSKRIPSNRQPPDADSIHSSNSDPRLCDLKSIGS